MLVMCVFFCTREVFNNKGIKRVKYSLSDIFVCARCGYCCQGETTVSLDDDDQQRMVAELDLERDSVKDQ